MIQTEVLIIGGGPAGSACAWRLKQANVDCIILDQHTFPRSKPCAGWITPDVLKDLSFTPKDYQYGLTTFHSFQVSLRCLSFKLPTLQYAVRRCEFDYWMLRRSGAAFQQHKVKSIERFTDGYVVDSMFSTRYLVGAGGTYCPVYRSIFKTISPKSRQSLIVAQVEEFPYAYTDERCRLWFFEDRLPGYSWYVPKANGYVNVGVGGKAERFNSIMTALRTIGTVWLKSSTGWGWCAGMIIGLKRIPTTFVKTFQKSARETPFWLATQRDWPPLTWAKASALPSRVG